MKKQLLIVILLLGLGNINAQNDDFTYKKIGVTHSESGTLTFTGDGANEPVDATAKASTTGYGETQGTLSVSLSGAAEYTVPIAVPPGINGVTPQLALTYNSHSGDGMAGYGWSISGLSVITRIPATKFHDNIKDPVDFDNSDRFALDGKRLILKSGSYGSSGAQYQTEAYSNIKIVSYGTSPYGANFGPEYFIVYYPDGSLAHYGQSENSRSQTTYAINYWQNPQGVKISYSYYIKGQNNIFINRIKYGGLNSQSPMNEIKFIKRGRTRYEQAFINNVDFKQFDLYGEIKIFSEGQEVRNYSFQYNRSNLEYFRLTGIIEKTANGTLSHKPIIFTYTNTPSTVNYTGITTDVGLNNIEQRNAETLSLDLTGNGKMDFIVYPKSASEKNKFWVFKDLQNGTINYPVQVNSGSFDAIFSANFLNSTNKLSTGQGLAIIKKNYDVSDNQILIKIYGNAAPSTGTALISKYQKVWNAPTYSNRDYCRNTTTVKRIPQKYVSGDFDGDGLTDIMAISQSYTYSICRKVDCSGGGGGTPKKLTDTNKIAKGAKKGCCNCTTYNVNNSLATFINLDRRVTTNFSKSVGNLSKLVKPGDKLFTADVNADGKTDILHVSEGNIYVYSLDNNNILRLLWKTIDSSIKLTYPLLFGDYNGDGKTDFLVPTANNSKDFITFMSTGSRFLKSGSKTFDFIYRQSYRNGSTIYGHNLVALDYNGDGRTDIIDYQTTTYDNSDNGEQTLNVYDNIGLYFSYPKAYPMPEFAAKKTTSKTGNLKHYPIPIFLTSDRPNKSLDFASISHKWITAFTFNNDHREDVLLRSVNNNGVIYDITYNKLDPNAYSSENFRIYQPATSEVFPNIDVSIAPEINVVTAIERRYSNTPTLKQLFSYYGAVFNTEGLGFKGFKGIAKSNWHTGNSDRIFQITKYNLALRGAITEEYTTPYTFNFTSVPSNFISKSSYTNASTLAANKVFKRWVTASVSQNQIEGTVTNVSYLYDTYNNPTKIVTNYAGQGSTVIEMAYANNTGTNYYIGRLLNKKETTTIGGNPFSTETQYTYTGNLPSQIKTKGNGTQFTVESYTYDVYGNVTQKTITPYNSSARQVRFEYDNSGRYLTKSYDTEGLLTTYEYNTNTGTLAKETNFLGQSTEYVYDGWNRLIKVTDFLGKSQNTTYTDANGTFTVSTIGEDGSAASITYDRLGRMLINKQKNVLGQWVSKSYQYDKFDRVAAESEPYTNAAPSQWNTSEYDFYGRLKSISTYTGKTTQFSYNGLVATANDGTKTVTTTKNALGNILRVTDPGGSINYTYYGNGTMKTANYGGTVISTTIDGWGRKTKLIDPSAGTYTYAYNGFGEITKETTPKGSTTYNYTSFGKILKKEIVGDATHMTLLYNYHPTNKQLSALSLSSTDGNNSTYNYSYDSQHRLTESIELTPYAQFRKRYSYDDFGRVNTEESYARLLATNRSSIQKVKNTYQYGALKSISDNSTHEVLWNVDEINSKGQVTKVTMGNNLQKNYTYNSLGFITDITSEKNTNTNPVEMMKLTFDFNTQRGLLNRRTNSLFTWTENFTYDNMDRLVSFNDNSGNKNHSYDNKGRIAANNNIGTYNYSGNSYKLASIALNGLGNTFYTPTNTQLDISYNAFKKPVDIYKVNKDRISFQYNAFMDRSNMFYGGTQTDKLLRPMRKHYSADGSMEITYEKNTGKTTLITYIGGNAYSAPAIWRSEQGTTNSAGYYYLHRDYLGSVLMISDSNGIIKEKRHFDAWGNIVKLQDGNGNDLSSFKILDRGYTGHEHLLGVGLVHMNGRLYDPLLHRFLAPDNFIQNPYNTQNYNRYGYVLNNPLKYTDPSGEKAEGGGILAFFAAAVISVFRAIFGSNDTGYSNANVSNTPVITDFSLGSNNSTEVAAMADVPPESGTGYRLEEPKGIWQGIKDGFKQSVNDISNFASGFGDGFYAGGVSTVNFVKSLATKEGWVNLGDGFLNMAALAAPTTGPGALANAQLSIAVGQFVDNIPNMTVYDYGYATGFGTEKVVEGILISKGVGAIGNSIRGVTVAEEGVTTWNGFQKMTAGEFSSRAEAAAAWKSYKQANGIVTGTARSAAQRSAFLKGAAASGKYPKWMNQWLRRGKTPPGYSVDHIKPLSIGGADLPSNMRLLDNHFHFKIHHKLYKPWL